MCALIVVRVLALCLPQLRTIVRTLRCGQKQKHTAFSVHSRLAFYDEEPPPHSKPSTNRPRVDAKSSRVLQVRINDTFSRTEVTIPHTQKVRTAGTFCSLRGSVPVGAMSP